MPYKQVSLDYSDIRIFGSPILLAMSRYERSMSTDSKNPLEKPCRGLGTSGGTVRTEKWALAVDAMDDTLLEGVDQTGRETGR